VTLNPGENLLTSAVIDAPDGWAFFGAYTCPGRIIKVNLGEGAGEDASRQPPGPHPNANSITAVGRDGRAAWRYHSGHQYQNFWTSGDGRWMITSVQRTRGKAGWDSGVMLFDVARAAGGAAKFVYYYQVEGLSFFRAAISGDGAAIAVVEVPCEDPQTKTLRGTYQVHVIR